MGEHTVGVVIPAHNEERHIKDVLETLPAVVDYAVVVDDGSTDQTYAMAQKASTSANITILQTKGVGVGAAIDLGHQHLLKTGAVAAECYQPSVFALPAGRCSSDRRTALRLGTMVSNEAKR